MTNSHHSPEADTNRTRTLSLWMLILSVVLTVMSVLMYAAIFKIGSEFEQLFSGFGAELPGLTLLVLKTHMYYWPLVLIGLVPCLVLIVSWKNPPKDKAVLFIFVVINGVLAFIIMGLVIFTMYLPIFSMGTVVGSP